MGCLQHQNPPKVLQEENKNGQLWAVRHLLHYSNLKRVFWWPCADGRRISLVPKKGFSCHRLDSSSLPQTLSLLSSVQPCCLLAVSYMQPGMWCPASYLIPAFNVLFCILSLILIQLCCPNRKRAKDKFIPRPFQLIGRQEGQGQEVRMTYDQ